MFVCNHGLMVCTRFLVSEILLMVSCRSCIGQYFRGYTLELVPQVSRGALSSGN